MKTKTRRGSRRSGKTWWAGDLTLYRSQAAMGLGLVLGVVRLVSGYRTAEAFPVSPWHAEGMKKCGAGQSEGCLRR